MSSANPPVSTQPPRPPGSTREQAVRTARRLMQTRSYLGFSFQDIADAVGVRKPSLYHHFPSKEALGVEVLREASQAWKAWTQAAQRSPQEWLDAYFRMYRNDLRAGERVCPGGALVPGWDCIDETLRGAVRAIRAEQVLWLTGVLGAVLPAASSSAPSPAPSISTLAAYVYASCQGALTTARMTGRVEDFDDVIDQVKRSLRA